MKLLRMTNWNTDFASLPEPVRLAWLGEGVVHSNLLRLTATDWAFRPEPAKSPWYVLDYTELPEYLLGLRWPIPYDPSKPKRAFSLGVNEK